jgi:hypothetical protein
VLSALSLVLFVVVASFSLFNFIVFVFVLFFLVCFSTTYSCITSEFSFSSVSDVVHTRSTTIVFLLLLLLLLLLFDRELYEIWCRVVPNGSAVVSETQRLQSLFHQASVYPSQSQILEMIHCARERELVQVPQQSQSQQEEEEIRPVVTSDSTIMATSVNCPSTDQQSSRSKDQTDGCGGGIQQRNYLTFGEFCLFANELRKCYERE